VPSSWAGADLSVSTGFLPRNAFVVDSLRHEAIVAGVVDVVRHVARGRRQAALTLVHYVVAAYAETVIRPLAVDGLEVNIAANQLAIQIGRDGRLDGLWVSKWATQPADDGSAHRVGRRLGAALLPVLRSACAVGQVGARTAATVAADAVLAAARRRARIAGHHDLSWADDLLAAAALPARGTVRLMEVHPDDGPAVEYMVPRVCCVLADKLTDSACPGCPRRDAEAARAATEAYLRDLDDDEFRAWVGRPRVLASA